MKKLDIFLLKVAPYVVGLFVWGFLTYLDFRFHSMDGISVVKSVLFGIPGLILLIFFYASFDEKISEDFMGKGIITIRLVLLILTVFFFMLCYISYQIAYTNLILVLNSIAFILFGSISGFIIFWKADEYLHLYYR